MEPKAAKVTSKGQVTVPKSVRDALGVSEGDVLSFEVVGDRAIVRRAPSVWEMREEARVRYGGSLTAEREGADRDAVEAYFLDKPPDDLGPLVLVNRGSASALGQTEPDEDGESTEG